MELLTILLCCLTPLPIAIAVVVALIFFMNNAGLEE